VDNFSCNLKVDLIFPVTRESSNVPVLIRRGILIIFSETEGQILNGSIEHNVSETETAPVLM
jgi:hypothetical protein